jgi:hypothetical protein
MYKNKNETIVSNITELLDNEIFSPAVDWVFKLLFGDERNKSMLIDLLGSFLELPKEEYDLVFLDTHLKKESEEDKLGIIDVKIRTKTGKIIDIEIQVDPYKEMGKRLSFYKSKLITGQIGEGGDYSVIQRVICVCITNYSVFRNRSEYLNKFVFCNPETGLVFDEMPEEVYTLELPKNEVLRFLSEMTGKNYGTGCSFCVPVRRRSSRWRQKTTPKLEKRWTRYMC